MGDQFFTSNLREKFLALGYSEEDALTLAYTAEQWTSEDIGHIESIEQATEELVDAFNRIVGGGIR